MPDIDEDILRQLMHRSTNDLHASSTVTGGILGFHRRRRLRNRALSVVVTGAAAGLFAGVVAGNAGKPAASDSAHSSGGGGGSGSGSTAAPTMDLTAAQQTLYKLGEAAALTPRQKGVYVVMREKATNNGDGAVESSESINVINTLTGSDVTYQDYGTPPGTTKPPTTLTAPSGFSPTQAQYDAMPTDTAALRALLLVQAEKQMEEIPESGSKPGTPAARKPTAPQETADDLVFQQATNLLWSPLLSPALRSAVYDVLAATPGVVVKTGAVDDAGRSAVEISRFDSVADMDYETFEDPATGATLESVFSTPYDSSTHDGGFYGSDLYQSITYTDTVPTNPYGNGS